MIIWPRTERKKWFFDYSEHRGKQELVMSKDVGNSWDKFFNPTSLKNNLLGASVYLTSYELLKNSMIDHLRSFYSADFKLDEETGLLEAVVDKDYSREVRSLYPKDEFHSCCLWFHQKKAVDQDDLQSIKSIRKQRNRIAHELPNMLCTEGSEIDTGLLTKAVEIIKKVDIWWMKEIEAPTNPDMDPLDLDEVDWGRALSGNMMILHFLLRMLEGDDDFLWGFYKDLTNGIKEKLRQQAANTCS